jgi:hypothetical protein
MRTAIDDLPCVSASRLRAAGLIGSHDTTAAVVFPAAPAFLVALSHLQFPNRGGWSFFLCPCGRRARTLRLHNGSLACGRCLRARGLRYRVEDLSKPERAAHAASRLKPRLASDTPVRLNPRPGRRLDRRGRLAVALWRAEYRAMRHLIGDG